MKHFIDRSKSYRNSLGEDPPGYDEVHRHSALKFVTPGARHRQEDSALRQRRKRLYEAAKTQRPERWSGPSRNWEAETIVYLNPNKSTQKEGNLKDKVA